RPCCAGKATRQDPGAETSDDARIAHWKDEVGMSTIGQIEKKTQQRVVNLFRDTLDYDYLGNWKDREGNRNIEEKLLRAFLTNKQGCDNNLITRALHLLDKAAGDTSKSLYDRNRSVY